MSRMRATAGPMRAHGPSRHRRTRRSAPPAGASASKLSADARVEEAGRDALKATRAGLGQRHWQAVGSLGGGRAVQ
eukprot:770923-Prymnesium_polylepis.1